MANPAPLTFKTRGGGGVVGCRIRRPGPANPPVTTRIDAFGRDGAGVGGPILKLVRSANMVYSCIHENMGRAQGNWFGVHEGSHPRYATAIPLSATMAGSVRAVHHRPLVTHAHVPAHNRDATFLGLPCHTNLRRIRRKVLRVQWGKANLTHLVTQFAMAKGFGAILPACAPMSLPIQVTCLHGFSEDL